MGERDDHRRRRRADALQRYADQYEAAGRALDQVYAEGERWRKRFVIRRNLIRRQRAQLGAPTSPEPSPAALLVTQKGWALHLYLIALFDAQSRRPPGGAIRNIRPLRATGRKPGWVDLLPATTATADQAAGMMRQTKRALTLLADHNLVKLNGRKGTAGRFEEFQLLDESGSSEGLWRQHLYVIPTVDELGGNPDPYRALAAKAGKAEAMQLPDVFFLNGWVHVLSAAEIVTYLMFRDLEARYPESSKRGVFVTEPNRAAWYGIGRDVYESHRQLAAYGLVERLADPNRRPDGKILHRPGGGQYLQPLRFRTLQHGLDRPALKTVIAALRKA
ncbi:hypothetical protein [Micromonospora sp. NPDC004704]